MSFLSANGVSSVGADAAVIVIISLLTIVTLIAPVVFLCRHNEKDVAKKAWVVPALLAIGFVIRLVFAMCIRGYREDYKMFTDMFSHIQNNGVGDYYKGNATATLYPVTFFIYLIFGGLANVTGLSDFTLGAQFAVKLPLIIADILAAYGIYKIAKRYTNTATAYALCAFVCVCPVFFIASAVWTSPVVFVAMFVVFACYFLARKNYAATIGFATLAAFSGKEGIYVFPVVLVFSVFHFVRAIVNIKDTKAKGKALLSSDCNAVITVPAAFILSVLAAYLIGLFMFSSYSYNIFVYIYEFLLEPFVTWTSFTYNGLSIYSVFGQNGAVPSARFPTWVFFAMFLVIVFAVVCVVYFSKRNRATMVMLASYALLTVLLYYPGHTAVGFGSCAAVILAAYALVRDKRILVVLFVIGLSYAINASSVLASAGYLNNLADYAFTGDAYIGSTLMTGGAAAVPIATSVLAVLSHLYYTYVTVSVGISGQKKLLSSADGIAASLKELFTVKRGD